MTFLKLKNLVILTLLFCGCSFYDGDTVNSRLPADSKPKIVAQKPPEFAKDFSLPDVNNEIESLLKYRGKIVLLVFWTSWSPVCCEKITVLNDIYDRTRGKGIEVLSINLDPNREKLETFVAKTGIKYKIFLDPKAEISQKYNIAGVPEYFVIDELGYIYSFSSNYNVAIAKVQELYDKRIK